MRAISILIVERGTTVLRLRAMRALRIRVSISPIASLVKAIFGVRPSPARLHAAREEALERQFTEADAAQAEAANEGARATALLAAIATAHFIFAALFAIRHAGFCHVVYPSVSNR